MSPSQSCPILPEEAAAIGLWQYGLLPTREIPFSPAVRETCAGNACRGYGATWACPPAVGSLEDCRVQCLSFPQMLVFSSRYPLEDSFDIEGMRSAMRSFKDVCDRLDDLVRPRLPRFLLLSNEGCFRCGKCTYPDSPCRFPDRLHPALEGYGILVGQLAKAAGLSYSGGPDTVVYFGALLF